MAKFKRGQKIRIKHSVSPNGKYSKVRGHIGVIEDCKWDGTYTIKVNGTTFSYVSSTVLESAETPQTEKEYMISQRNSLRKKAEELDSRLKYLEETGKATFNEKEYKIYKALQTMDTNMPDIQKAQVIAEIVS